MDQQALTRIAPMSTIYDNVSIDAYDRVNFPILQSNPCIFILIIDISLSLTFSYIFFPPVDSAVSFSSQKDKFLFMLAIAIGSLDVVLLIVTVMLFLGIRRHQSAKRHPVLSRKKAKN